MQRSVISLESREKISLVAVFIIFLILAGGLAKLQLIEHSDLARQSENNRLRVVPIVPPRGIVTDREDRTLVDNRPSYTIAVVPAEIASDITLKNLSYLLEMDTTEIMKRIRKNMVSKYQPVPVKRDVSFEAVAILEEQMTRFPGVTYQMEQVRQYCRNLSTESFTGYVGEVSLMDLKDKETVNLRLGSTIGKKGLEKLYDLLLRGQEGTAYIEVMASGQMLGPYQGKNEIAAVAGADLKLSIDIDLQEACVSALDTFCCGAAVAMDPRNGEILAMASYPGYDANIFSSVIPESLWQQISGDSTYPLLNRPLNGQYPPGSTVKLVTIGAALEEGVINQNTTLKPCTGGYRFGNRVFRCWELAGHGSLNAAHSLEQSCDVFMYQLGLKLGLDILSRYFSECGFGQPTGIDLPGEFPGLNPNRQYYNKRYGENGWTRALILNISIGQGELLVTPLQLAQFFCGLANNGIVYRPHIVKTIKYPDGRENSLAPQISFKLPFSSSTLEILKEGMRLVVEGKHGTARSLKNNRYSLGGKTGTAENPHGENHSWFVGVAPLEAPEIVVCAIVENAGHGSEVAAPVVGRIIEAYMKNRGGPTGPVTMNNESRP